MTQATTPAPVRRAGTARPGRDGPSSDARKTSTPHARTPRTAPDDGASDVPGTVARLTARAKGLQAWWNTTRPARALAQYGVQRGALLCGGMAYSALFSLFAGLTIFYTAFMAFLGNREELRDEIFAQIDKAIPGLIDTGDGSSGIISPDQLILDRGFDLSSIIAVFVLLFSAISFMAALRTSTRAMFSLTNVGQNPVLSKLRELGGFAVLGISVVISAAATVVVQSLGATIFGDGVLAAVLVPVGGILVGLVFDAIVVLLIVRFVAGVRPPRKDLYIGAMTAAAAFGVLRYLGTSIIVGSSSRNALLGSFATFVTILLLANFVTRILLMVAAWIADPPAQPTADELREQAEAEQDERLEARVRRGAGYGYPWSPLVRGVRRGREPRVSVRL
ncbi:MULTISPECIES: YihY/virulence factor BrkB family protein [Oerskovia]|uniref:YihY/virulence factor BrkB family protein n=1 Tax=Oerskovia rustica TaxID=2762237 RepID=A0ABR8RN26_9CELL|nr:YihY/virulence factor BrkB family protein [Oerskovia rustica]MBD7949163.1 YihY/virulence factor BrkB family protein [Oerskovia rustica]